MTEAYVPHPGSRLDAVASAAAAESAPEPVEQIGEVSGDQMPVVPVAPVLPALGRGYVVVLGAANPVLPVLPQDDKRRSAVIIAVDNDVYLASTRDAAAAAAGAATSTTAFYLPKGMPVAIWNKSAWYAAATTASGNSRVSVLISADD